MIDGQQIERIRRDYKWTREELSKQLGVKSRTVQGWESGKLTPSKQEEEALWLLKKRYSWPAPDFFDELLPYLKIHCGGQRVKDLAAKHEIPKNALLRFAEMFRECSGRYDERIVAIAEQRDLFEAMLRKVRGSKRLGDDLSDEIDQLLDRYAGFQNINHGFPSLHEELRRYQAETVELLSRANEKQRELLVADALCIALEGNRFALKTNEVESDIVDVYWHDQGIQIKVLSSGQPHREAKQKLELLEMSRCVEDVFSEDHDQIFNKVEVPWDRVMDSIRDLVDKKFYSQNDKARTHLLLYFNLKGKMLSSVLPKQALLDAGAMGWLSVSIVTSFQVFVLHAEMGCPEWLCAAVGKPKILSLTEAGRMWRFDEIYEQKQGVFAVRQPRSPKQNKFF